MHPLLGLSPASARLATALSSLASAAALPATPTPQVKAYSDCVYFNYHPLGISLVYHPSTPAYKPKTGTPLEDLELNRLRLAQVDVYNHETGQEERSTSDEASSSKPRPPSALKPTYAVFPSYPLLLRLPAPTSATESPTTPATKHSPLLPTTVGVALVSTLGEPDRKGGGVGSIGVWTEWTSEGVMVEWASSGLQAWDKGASSVWRCVSLFERGVAAGKLEGEDESVV